MVYRGSEHDVLDRYYQAAHEPRRDVVVRITGDCPLIDPAIVDRVIGDVPRRGRRLRVQRLCRRPIPDGLDIEVFSFKALETAWREARERREREHVTPFMRDSGRFTHGQPTRIARTRPANAGRSTSRRTSPWSRRCSSTFIRAATSAGTRCWRCANEQPELFAANRHLIRNEGAVHGHRAETVEARQAGHSRRQHAAVEARGNVPAGAVAGVLQQGEGLPGLGSRWQRIHRHVASWASAPTRSATATRRSTTRCARRSTAGNMSTLNCPEEVYLAEKLVELHPWADMVRFARSGGEANAIAMRIARAATGQGQGRDLRLPRLARLVPRRQSRRRQQPRRPPAARPRAERRAAQPARQRPAVQLQPTSTTLEQLVARRRTSA